MEQELEELPGTPGRMAFVRSIIVSSLCWSVSNLLTLTVFGLAAIWLEAESKTYIQIKSFTSIWLFIGWMVTGVVVGPVVFFRARKFYRCERVRIAMSNGFKRRHSVPVAEGDEDLGDQ